MSQIDTQDPIGEALARRRASAQPPPAGPDPITEALNRRRAQLQAGASINASTGLDASPAPQPVGPPAPPAGPPRPPVSPFELGDGTPHAPLADLDIVKQIDQSKQQDQQAVQAGFLGRTAAATRVAIGSGLDASTANVDRLLNEQRAHPTPGRLPEGPLAPNQVGSEMMGVTDQTKQTAERAGLGSNIIAGAAAFPTSFLDPTALGPMGVLEGPAMFAGRFAPKGVGLSGEISKDLAPLLAGIESRAGPKVASVAGHILQGQLGVGSFSGMHAAASYPNWDTDPAGGLGAVAQATEQGVEAGTLFGAAGALMHGRAKPHQQATSEALKQADTLNQQAEGLKEQAHESGTGMRGTEAADARAAPPLAETDHADPGRADDAAGVRPPDQPVQSAGPAAQGQPAPAREPDGIDQRVVPATGDQPGPVVQPPRNSAEALALNQKTRQERIAQRDALIASAKPVEPPQEPVHVPQPEEAARQEVPAQGGGEVQEQAPSGPIGPAGDAGGGKASAKAPDAAADVLSEPERLTNPPEMSETVDTPQVSTNPPRPIKSKPYTQQQIEQELTSKHRAINPDIRQEEAGTGANTRTFFNPKTPDGKLSTTQRWSLLPSEIREQFSPKEAEAAGFTTTRIRGQSGGEDRAQDIGWEKYAAEARQDAGGASAETLSAREFFAQNPSADPEGALLGAIHAGKGKNLTSVAPADLKAGDAFTIKGKPVRVESRGEGDTAHLVLTGEHIPETPVEALSRVPMDKGSLGNKLTQSKIRPIGERPIKEPTDASRLPDEAVPVDAPTPTRAKGTADAGAGGANGPGRVADDRDNAPAGRAEDGGRGVLPKTEDAKTEEPNTIGLSQAHIDNLRQELGLSELPEPAVKTRLEVLDKAKRLGLPDQAEEYSRQATETGRPLTDEQHAGAVIQAAELKKAYRDLIEQAQQADNAKETDIARGKRAEAEHIRARVDSLTDAMKMTGTAAGRSLAIRGLEIDAETHDPVKVIRDFEAAKEQKSTPEERQKIESLSKIILENQKVIEEANKREARKDAQIAKLKAGQVLTRTVPRAEPGRRIADAKAKLSLERNDLKRQLLSLTKRANDITGIAPEALYLLGRLAINHIRDGALTLEEVARKVMADAKDSFPDMTADDVNLALTAKDPGRQRVAKDAAQKRVEALKREAGLTQKLAAEAAKLQAEKPAKSMQAQKSLVEQQIKLGEKSDALTARRAESAQKKATEKAATQEAQKQVRVAKGQMRMILQQLKLNAQTTIDAGRRRDAIVAKIDALRQHLDEHSRPIKGKERAADPADIASMKQEVEDLRRSMRTEDTLTDLQEQIRTGDFKSASRPEPRPVPKDVQLGQIKIARARQQIRKMVEDARPKTLGERISKAVTGWVRFGALSYPTVLAKLSAAATIRTLSTPIEQAIGLGISKALPRLAEAAPREGVTSAKTALGAEAAAQVRMWTEGMRGSWDMLRNRRTNLELLHGKDDLPPELTDYLGRLHGALKNPVKEAEFARALSLRTEHALRTGVDIADPIQQIRLSNESYQDANRAIFMQDNKVTDAWKRAVRALEEPSKATGKPTAAQYLAMVAKADMPIVKVPINVVAETTEVLTGMLTGPARAALAYARGIENLKPVEADAIMRSMKKGSIGASLLLLGFFNPSKVGGYYQPGERRKTDEPKPGDIGPVPHLLLHNPFMEAVQFGATIRRVADAKYLKRQPDPNGLLSGTAAAALGLLEEVPFVRETEGISKVLDPRTRDNAVGSWISSKAIPGVIQWTAKQTDRDASGPVHRHPAGVIESLKAAIPSLRQSVPEFHTSNQARERMHELYDSGKRGEAIQVKVRWNREHPKDRIGDDFIGSPAQSRP